MPAFFKASKRKASELLNRAKARRPMVSFLKDGEAVFQYVK
jgi:fibrillarin-like rRNA methylase